MATIKDVASHAGVSIGTVSKYINNITIRKDNYERIQQAVEELNYRVNATARSMKTSKTKLIAVLMSDIADVYYPSVVKYIERELYHYGYNVMVLISNDSVSLEREKIELMLGKNIDGFIVFPILNENDNYKYILEQEKPMVIVDQLSEDLPCIQVVPDNISGAYEATMKLIRNGHKRLGIITEGEKNPNGSERLEGFLLAHKSSKINIDENYIFDKGFKPCDGYEAMEYFSQMKKPPTAILMCNEYVLNGAIKYINMQGIRIPKDFEIAAYDGNFILDICNFPMIIIEQNIKELARVVSKSIVAELESEFLHRDESEVIRIPVMVH